LAVSTASVASPAKALADSTDLRPSNRATAERTRKRWMIATLEDYPCEPTLE
jgi:hypothetical protein